MSQPIIDSLVMRTIEDSVPGSCSVRIKKDNGSVVDTHMGKTYGRPKGRN